MKLSVIILNYRVPRHLLLCLQSVEKALRNLDAEIIVVDNHSEDESCELVQRYFPEVILVENSENYGFSKGNNKGVETAKGEYICLLNPDTLVSETVFKNTLHFAENHPDFGAIGVKMIDGTGSFLPESKRNLPTPKVAFQKLTGKSDNYYANHLKQEETGKVEILAGAFMFMKKSRYLKVGGLDEDYFMYGEDINLSYQFIKEGYQNYYLGEETILHFKGESTIKDKEYAERFYGAMRLFYQKNFLGGKTVDLMVKNVLNLAKASRNFRSENKETPKTIEKTYLVSDGQEGSIDEKIQNYLEEYQILSPSEIETQSIKNSMLMFDIAHISFQEVFGLMESLKNRGNKFRIKPRGFNFIFGSDCSTERGEVVFL